MGIFQTLKQKLGPVNESNEPGKPGPDHRGREEDAATPYGKLLTLTQTEKFSLVSQLTGRERELYLLLLQGYTLKESAQQLGVKYSTANTHMTGLYKKLRVGTRAELIINYRDCADGARSG